MDLGISGSEVHAALKRLAMLRLTAHDPDAGRPLLEAVEEFLLHGVKYPESRGATLRRAGTGCTPFSAPAQRQTPWVWRAPGEPDCSQAVRRTTTRGCKLLIWRALQDSNLRPPGSQHNTGLLSRWFFVRSFRMRPRSYPAFGRELFTDCALVLRRPLGRGPTEAAPSKAGVGRRADPRRDADLLLDVVGVLLSAPGGPGPPTLRLVRWHQEASLRDCRSAAPQAL
jgi:hypothetical protein